MLPCATDVVRFEIYLVPKGSFNSFLVEGKVSVLGLSFHHVQMITAKYAEFISAVTWSCAGSAEITAINPGYNHVLIKKCSTQDVQSILCSDDFQRPLLNYSMIL